MTQGADSELPGWHVVVAATAGPRARTQAASPSFTPLRQLRPPEVCPLVSHGRLDTGSSALEDTADLDFEVNSHWRHRQDSADGLEYRRLFDLSLGIWVCAIMKFHWFWVAIDGGNMIANCSHLNRILFAVPAGMRSISSCPGITTQSDRRAKKPGVAVPLDAAGCRGNCRRVVDGRGWASGVVAVSLQFPFSLLCGC